MSINDEEMNGLSIQKFIWLAGNAYDTGTPVDLKFKKIYHAGYGYIIIYIYIEIGNVSKIIIEFTL